MCMCAEGPWVSPTGGPRDPDCQPEGLRTTGGGRKREDKGETWQELMVLCGLLGVPLGQPYCSAAWGCVPGDSRSQAPADVSAKAWGSSAEPCPQRSLHPLMFVFPPLS